MRQKRGRPEPVIPLRARSRPSVRLGPRAEADLHTEGREQVPFLEMPRAGPRAQNRPVPGRDVPELSRCPTECSPLG